MLKNRFQLLKLAGFLVALAPTIATRDCAFFIVGKPELPNKLKNN